jgi:hypothetical protein
MPNRRLLPVQYLVYTLNSKLRMDFAASETNDITATENPDKMCRTVEWSSCISNLFEDAVGNSSLLASLHSHAIIIITVNKQMSGKVWSWVYVWGTPGSSPGRLTNYPKSIHCKLFVSFQADSASIFVRAKREFAVDSQYK